MKVGYKFSNNNGLEFKVISTNGEDCKIRREDDGHIFTFDLKMLGFLADSNRITELEESNHA